MKKTNDIGFFGVCEKFCVSAPPDKLWADIFLIFKNILLLLKSESSDICNLILAQLN